MIIGLSLSFAPFIAASIRGIPFLYALFMNSTIKIAFFEANPITAKSATWKYTSLLRSLKYILKTAPKTPKGTTNKTEKGTLQLS